MKQLVTLPTLVLVMCSWHAWGQVVPTDLTDEETARIEGYFRELVQTKRVVDPQPCPEFVELFHKKYYEYQRQVAVGD
ncbi:MAG: hypothetical protein GY851_34030, partial [bacterium]|nr:hypothetical protein [bacterium]